MMSTSCPKQAAGMMPPPPSSLPILKVLWFGGSLFILVVYPDVLLLKLAGQYI